MKTPRVPRISHVKRPLRILIGVTLTTLATVYILLKIDLEQTWETLTSANLWWFGLAIAIRTIRPGDRRRAFHPVGTRPCRMRCASV